MITNWKHIILKETATIKEAMQNLGEFGLRIVLIADEDNHLLGTVSDGDIRRGLLRGFDLEDSISRVMNENPISVFAGTPSAEIQEIFSRTDILAVPIVDAHKKIIGLETVNSVNHNVETDTVVVLMAGGFGKRLLPLTEHLPKPMLPLGDDPIIEHIIESLRRQGFKNFCIATHYKSSIIQEHFSQEKYKNTNIEFVIEDEPLGTAGALFFLKDKIHSDFIVMNSDLLLKTNFRDLLYFHKEHGKTGTMCTKEYKHKVPYGVVSLEDMTVSGILEKPSYSHLINAGAYCFSPDIFKYFQEKKYVDMTTILQNVMSAGQKICAFPIHEYWMDIGNLDDYQSARQDHT